MFDPIPETTHLRTEQLAQARHSFIQTKAQLILGVSERPPFLIESVSQEDYVTALTGAETSVQRLLIRARVSGNTHSIFREIGDLFHLTAVAEFAKQEILGRFASTSTRKDQNGYWIQNARLDRAIAAVAIEEPELVRVLALNGTISPEYYQQTLAARTIDPFSSYRRMFAGDKDITDRVATWLKCYTSINNTPNSTLHNDNIEPILYALLMRKPGPQIIEEFGISGDTITRVKKLVHVAILDLGTGKKENEVTPALQAVKEDCGSAFNEPLISDRVTGIFIGSSNDVRALTELADAAEADKHIRPVIERNPVFGHVLTQLSSGRDIAQIAGAFGVKISDSVRSHARQEIAAVINDSSYPSQLPAIVERIVMTAGLRSQLVNRLRQTESAEDLFRFNNGDSLDAHLLKMARIICSPEKSRELLTSVESDYLRNANPFDKGIYGDFNWRMGSFISATRFAFHLALATHYQFNVSRAAGGKDVIAGIFANDQLTLERAFNNLDAHYLSSEERRLPVIFRALGVLGNFQSYPEQLDPKTFRSIFEYIYSLPYSESTINVALSHYGNLTTNLINAGPWRLYEGRHLESGIPFAVATNLHRSFREEYTHAHGDGSNGVKAKLSQKIQAHRRSF